MKSYLTTIGTGVILLFVLGCNGNNETSGSAFVVTEEQYRFFERAKKDYDSGALETYIAKDRIRFCLISCMFDTRARLPLNLWGNRDDISPMPGVAKKIISVDAKGDLLLDFIIDESASLSLAATRAAGFVRNLPSAPQDWNNRFALAIMKQLEQGTDQETDTDLLTILVAELHGCVLVANMRGSIDDPLDSELVPRLHSTFDKFKNHSDSNVRKHAQDGLQALEDYRNKKSDDGKTDG